MVSYKNLVICLFVAFDLPGFMSWELFPPDEKSYGVAAEITCANNKPNREKCKEMSFVFKNSEHWSDPPTAKNLTMRYSKRFGDLECEFYTNHRQSSDFSFMTICYRKGVPEHMVEGMFFDDYYRYLPYFSKEENTQYLLRKKLVVLGEGEYRSLSDEYDSLNLADDIMTSSQEVKHRSLGWRYGVNANKHPDPMIEIAVVVDHSFVEIHSSKTSEAEMWVHNLMNGAQATYQTVGIDLKIVHFIAMNQSLSNQILPPEAKEYPELMEKMTAFSKDHLYEVSDIRRINLQGEFRVRGQPDLVILFTNRQLEEPSRAKLGGKTVGMTLKDSLCYTSALALIRIQSESTISRAKATSMYATTVAHEIGHAFGLNHTICPGCSQNVGVCVMNALAVNPSGRFAPCRLQEISSLIARAKLSPYKDCLFTKNVFSKVEEIKIPKEFNVQVEVTHSLSQNVGVFVVEGIFLGKLEIEFEQSMDLILHAPEQQVCMYYHSTKGQPFAVIERCDGNYMAMIHTKASRVIVKHEKHIPSYVAYMSSLSDSSPTQMTPNHDAMMHKKISINVLIGIDYSFRQKVGGLKRCMTLIATAVNAADAVYRQIGMRIKVVGLHHLASNDSHHGYEKQIKFLYSNIYADKKIKAFLVFTSKSSFNFTNNHKPRKSVCSYNRDIIFIRHQDDDEDKDSSYSMGLTMAHLIGHVFGLPDESKQSNCSCYTPVGTCIMGHDTSIIGSSWSKCSQDALQALNCEQWAQGERTRDTTIGALRIVTAIFAVIFTIILIMEITNFAHPVTGLFGWFGEWRG